MSKIKSPISIVMVTRWASAYLENALNSIEKNSTYDHEIIVVADFPSWQTLKILQERRIPHFTVDFAHYMMCCDYGAWKAHREYIGTCNDDVYFGPAWDEAVMEIIKPNVMASVPRYEYNLGYPCGYDFVNLDTFKPELLDEAIAKNKPLGYNIGGVGCPMVHHREIFFQFYGYTFHTHQGHGHERKLQSRMVSKLPGFQTIQSLKSGVFHFGPTSNKDNVAMPVNVAHDEDLGWRAGLKLCLGCGKRERGWCGNESSQECTEIAQNGYWICQDCKEVGKKDVGKFRIWDTWQREEF